MLLSFVQLYEKLKNVHPNLMVYRKEDLPDRWHYKRGKYVSAITLVADPGWVILHVRLNARKEAAMFVLPIVQTASVTQFFR